MLEKSYDKSYDKSYEIKNGKLFVNDDSDYDSEFIIDLRDKKREEIYTIKKESELGYFTVPIFLFLFWVFPACIFFIPMMITLFLYESFSYNFLQLRVDDYSILDYKERDWIYLKKDIDEFLRKKEFMEKKRIFDNGWKYK